jgi:hypothetical protein
LEQIGLWSTSQLSLCSGVFTWKPELSFRCLIYKVISFIISTLYIEHCLLILPLFVAICEIWLPRLTYGVYLILFLKPGATGHLVCPATDQPVHAVIKFCLTSLMMSSLCHTHFIVVFLHKNKSQNTMKIHI